MNLDKARLLFFEESNELLTRMEADLLQLESQLEDQELIASLFRAAHTIKGAAGIFGYHDITNFVHCMEHLLAEWREGRSQASAASVQRLLEARDLSSQMIQDAMADRAESAELAMRRRQLMEALMAHAAQGPTTGPASQPEAAEPDVPASDQGALFQFGWRIAFQPERGVFKLGLDPLAPLRELATQSKIEDVEVDFASLPVLRDLDAELCYLSYSANLSGSVSRQDIESAFEFFDGVANWKISEGAADSVRASEPLLRSQSAADLPRSEIEAAARSTAASPSDRPQPVDRSAAAAAGFQAPGARFLRVESGKLDQLVNLVGELVIAGANISQLAAARNDPQLNEASASILRMIAELREQSLRVRMVQLGETFARFQRVVRDLGAETGKSVRLSISGGETELDKTVVEKIVDPLMHLVRNAVDHGLERPEERESAGKPREGLIVLQAYQETGSIVVEVRDDGRGFRLERILETARRRGLVEAGAQLDEQQILALVFQPGFSTATELSTISGRGVGLDVVQKNIEALRGSIQIENQPDHGSLTRIRLPLTLAIIEGFQVRVGQARYILPMDMVLECVDAPEDSATGILNLRGEALPCVPLHALFGESGSGRSVVVVQYGARKAGLLVDELLGEFQTVIKPLGRLFAGVRGINSATILGDGAVALILDVPSLVELAARHEAHSVVAGGRT
ncbi:MAG: chemotaxis protein CheA [Leptospirales bacterium]|nr:chemotaxis protein CheA [Leptospirales bacterium]